MFHNIVKYSYDDITICPAVTSEISHRSECNTLLKSGFLPIFASPMSTVVDEKNYPMFEANRIIPILPRTKDFPLAQRLEYALLGKWAAFSLQEFEDNFTVEIGQPYNGLPYTVLIDIANGHMERLFTAVSKAKEIWDDKLTVMIGNVANPETYVRCCECGADYVRFSIGSGFGCITSSQTGIHYPIASLINETYLIKKQYARVHNIEESLLPKIVADGGIRGYKDVVKALCLGADYVMIGSEFAKLVESAAPLYAPYDDAISNERLNRFRFNIREENGHFTVLFDCIVNIRGGLYKKFYGMASRQGQIDMNGSKDKTSEGVCKEIKVTTNIDKWSDNMTDYLKSAMSYLGIKDITSLNPMNVETYVLSENAKNSINK